jgi:mycothiol synthase
VSEEKEKEGLKMDWPEDLLNSPPAVRLPVGYTMRTYQPGDEEGFYVVMELAGFTRWNEELLRPWFSHILPDGWFLIEHRASREIVATAMATHRPQEIHPFGGELGWVAGHPAHSGKGLGMAICASAVRRLLQGGYKNIYLNTDDWRLPALSIYLRLGWIPFLYLPDMEERWRNVCAKLNWPFTPGDWPASHSQPV